MKFFLSLNLKKGVEDIEKKGNEIIAPAIEIDINNEKVFIVGKIENISEKGLISYSNQTSFSKVKLLADLLILSYFKNYQTDIIFLKNQKIQSFKFTTPEKWLKKIVLYYFESLKRPSFLIEPWIGAIQKNDVVNLSGAMNDIWIKNTTFIDGHTGWCLKNLSIPQPLEILKNDYTFLDAFSEDK